MLLRAEGDVSTERDPIFGCELVTSRLDRDGYAYHGKSRAHLVAWIAARGDVPLEHEIDHLCRRRHCIALQHLEPVTRSENELRKSWEYRARRKLCARGHELRLTMQVTPERGIVCRQCNRDAADSRADHPSRGPDVTPPPGGRGRAQAAARFDPENTKRRSK